MAAEPRHWFGSMTGRWTAAVVVILAVVGYSVWFYFAPRSVTDRSDRAEAIAGAPSPGLTQAAGDYATSTKENTATPMIGRSFGYDGSPRPKTPDNVR